MYQILIFDNPSHIPDSIKFYAVTWPPSTPNPHQPQLWFSSPYHPAVFCPPQCSESTVLWVYCNWPEKMRKSEAHRVGKGDALTGSSQVRAGEAHKIAAHIPLWFYSPSSTAAHTHGPEKGGENGTVSVSQTHNGTDESCFMVRESHKNKTKKTTTNRPEQNTTTPRHKTPQELNWMVHEESMSYKQHWRRFL